LRPEIEQDVGRALQNLREQPLGGIAIIVTEQLDQ
jgi:hypothetical protein